DKAKVYGADLKVPFGGFCLAGEYAKNKVSGLTINDNDAWEASLGYGCCSDSKFGFKAGYREIGAGFWSAGNWTRVGDAFNPNNIKGWFADAKYDFGKSFGIYGGFQNYNPADIPAFTDLESTKGGLKFGLGSKSSLQAEYEKVKGDYWALFAPKTTYLTFAYSYKFNPQADLRFGYQTIKEDFGAGIKNKGGVAFAQFGVSF
ncbi:MAG: porin, partial [Abditibacteriota bacterium]|nr:porin [Abditibacteriota bacterium]